MAPPGLDDDPGLGPVPEPFHAEALVAELPVEALGRAIPPRLAGLDTGALQPLQDSAADELRAVVGPQIPGRAPCSLTNRASTSMTRLERMLPWTSIARASWVHSSVTTRHFRP